MKRILLFVYFIFSMAGLGAQESDTLIEQDKIGISVSTLGSSILIRFQQLEGAPGYDARRLFTAGINYIHPLNKRFDLETGFEFTNFSTTLYPAVNPDADLTPTKGYLNIVSIPFRIRVKFPYLFYVNGGLLLDMDMSSSSDINTQTGIGGMFGFGWKYGFKSGTEITVNPYIKMHSLLSFSMSANPLRLLESGLRVGVMIPLDNLK